MPKKGGGGSGSAPSGDKRLAFFDAMRKQKLETVRWSMRHGGQQVSTRDDDNMTCLMVCAYEGKSRSLGEILEFLGRQNSKRGGSSRSEAGEAVDGLELANDDGHTALMLACKAGKKECAALLVKYGANLKTKNTADGGKTARDYCGKMKAMVEWLDRGGKDEEVAEVEEKEDPNNPLIEGESSTARSRRLRKEREAKEAGRGNRKEVKEEVVEEEELVFAADKDDRLEAIWPEVQKALDSAETVQQTQKEVNCIKMVSTRHQNRWNSY